MTSFSFFFFFIFVFSLLLDAMENSTQNKDFNHIKTKNKKNKNQRSVKTLFHTLRSCLKVLKGLKTLSFVLLFIYVNNSFIHSH